MKNPICTKDIKGWLLALQKRQTGEFFKIPSSLGALEMRFHLEKKIQLIHNF